MTAKEISRSIYKFNDFAARAAELTGLTQYMQKKKNQVIFYNAIIKQVKDIRTLSAQLIPLSATATAA